MLVLVISRVAIEAEVKKLIRAAMPMVKVEIYLLQRAQIEVRAMSYGAIEPAPPLPLDNSNDAPLRSLDSPVQLVSAPSLNNNHP